MAAAGTVGRLLREAGAGPVVWVASGDVAAWSAGLAAEGFQMVAAPDGADVVVVADTSWNDAPLFRRRRFLLSLHDRLSPAALLALVPAGWERPAGECGYEVIAIADGCVLARVVAAVAPDQAGEAYEGEGSLDLRWSPDEVDWLRPDPRGVWHEVTAVAETARAYALHDPYGGHRGAAVLSRHLGCPIDPGHVTFGAGVASLLRDLVALADGGTVLVGRYGFADVPGWVTQARSPVRVFDESAAWCEAIRRARPSLVIADRPTQRGVVHPVDQALAEASRLGAVVVIDEANANYLDPAQSAAWLTARHDNLVVVRGLSKGYCQGGLRVGYAIASAALSRRVRAAVPALQTSELALQVALRMLALPDPLAGLRARIAEMRPRTERALTAFGLQPDPGHPALPWLTAPATALDRLAERGVLAKRLRAADRSAPDLAKIAVPLSDERAAMLTDALTDAPTDRAAGPADALTDRAKTP
ncbi:Histidinol-phosphate/aromatic aminotransferase or cobyric acid decarboxylase [Nonomuraea solani]|uniref:histidinol-phosphate transaminase n=1 Tax=Nonomuraea solani TaxID=1144553 RepID=A0A1H6EVD7_9ACTN|nr:aminotransferase class I/II-fold pyridoxal phosphate-dependent enzyme [Nonomuraea solani]SEH01051.1 Histidinol-phosphate/aromatic aminotransferase or cobyric acid decarboxylase [Nonomuraea solani]